MDISFREDSRVILWRNPTTFFPFPAIFISIPAKQQNLKIPSDIKDPASVIISRGENRIAFIQRRYFPGLRETGRDTNVIYGKG